jgi:hypothetical protein
MAAARARLRLNGFSIDGFARCEFGGRPDGQVRLCECDGFRF